MVKLNVLGLVIFLCCANLNAQSKAPDFQFETIDQSISELSELKGEVLYVSFWASWCSPCISNFKKYAPMRDSLEAAGVILLNVNIDKVKDKWYQAINEHKINGEHVRGVDLKKLQEQYQLYSIPSYEIINKKGELVYLSEDPDRDILIEFENWVKE